MERSKKIVVVMPAYNAEKTLERTLDDIPREWVDDIILVDDASRDGTVALARKLGLRVFVHEENRGYGGNQKTCYTEAMKLGADELLIGRQPLVLEPVLQLPEALTLSGLIKYRFEYDWPGGESDIKKALDLNPNYGIAHLCLPAILLNNGQIDKAIEENSTALELDPLSLYVQGTSAVILYQAGRYDDALKQCQKSLELDPEYPFTLATLGRCYVQKSLFQEARERQLQVEDEGQGLVSMV